MKANNDIEIALALVTREHALHITPAFVPATSGGLGPQLVGALGFAANLAERWSVHRAGEPPEMALANEQLSLLVSLRNTPVRNEAHEVVRVDTVRHERTFRELVVSQVEHEPALSGVPQAPEPKTAVKAVGDKAKQAVPVTSLSPPPSVPQIVPTVSQTREQLAPVRRALGAEFKEVLRVHQRVMTRELLEQLKERVDQVVTHSPPQEHIQTELDNLPSILSERTTASIDEVTTKVVGLLERRLRASRERRGLFS